MAKDRDQEKKHEPGTEPTASPLPPEADEESALKTDPGPSEEKRPKPSRVADPPAGEAGDQEAPAEVRRVIEILSQAFPELRPYHKELDWTEVVVPAHLLPKVAAFVRDDERLRLNFLSSLSAVDYQDDGFQVVYHLISIPTSQPKLIIKVKAEGGRDNPRVPSVVDIWPTANWHEREAWDLMGIRFEGHPDLRRILLREDWEGHPLRKDYVDDRPPRERQHKDDWVTRIGRGLEHE